MAQSHEFALERGVVFDDAVVDHGQPALAIQMRVGVGGGDTTVRRRAVGPTGERAAGKAWRGWAALACMFFHKQPGGWGAVLPRRDAPRAVAAVLELFQAGQDALSRVVTRPDVTK